MAVIEPGESRNEVVPPNSGQKPKSVCVDHKQCREANLVVKNLVVDWCWVASLSGAVLLWVLARCAVVESTVELVNLCTLVYESFNILYSLLRPLQVFLHFFRGPHAFSKASLCAHQSSLSKGLQFKELAVLGVELTRSGASQFCHLVGIEHSGLLSMNNKYSRLSLLGQTAV
jgi:hypothetical protein